MVVAKTSKMAADFDRGETIGLSLSYHNKTVIRFISSVITKILARNNLIELNDSIYYYLVSIQDYKLKNELAPVEYVETNIKNLILNKRKIEFLKQIEENIYKEGIRQNKFKIYTEKWKQK